MGCGTHLERVSRYRVPLVPAFGAVGTFDLDYHQVYQQQAYNTHCEGKASQTVAFYGFAED